MVYPNETLNFYEYISRIGLTSILIYKLFYLGNNINNDHKSILLTVNGTHSKVWVKNDPSWRGDNLIPSTWSSHKKFTKF